jgi:succinate dehydrogenase / fumarate reductase cytochrome b subunit
VAVAYIVVMCVLALHLYHGVWSGMQTLGLSHERYNRYRRPVSLLVTAVVFLGFVSVPVGVLTGALALS